VDIRPACCHCFPNVGGPVLRCCEHLRERKIEMAQIEFPFVRGRSRTAQASDLEHGLNLGISAKRAAILLLPITLAACAGDDSRGITYTDDRGVANQPYPNNYRAELLAFMKTYLNNPVGVHNAAMAEPVQRTVGGRLRYVSCLRFAPRESDGSYREVRERAILYVDGRLDRVVENASDSCAGAVYAPFPELEKLTR
jgi:hypothetical protein